MLPLAILLPWTRPAPARGVITISVIPYPDSSMVSSETRGVAKSNAARHLSTYVLRELQHIKVGTETSKPFLARIPMRCLEQVREVIVPHESN
jgi:hypothetical protein